MITGRTIALFLALVLGCAHAAVAGQMFEVRCDACALKTTMGLGGGMRFEQATGWCRTCSAFRSVSWRRGTPDPYRSETQRVPAPGVYPCPKCSVHFAPIQSKREVVRPASSRTTSRSSAPACSSDRSTSSLRENGWRRRG